MSEMMLTLTGIVPNFLQDFSGAVMGGEDYLISSAPLKEENVITSVCVRDNCPLILTEQALSGCGVGVRISSKEEKEL